MALRYWVGGTNPWDGTAGTKWALTSGGAGGQAVPTSSDDVIFDGNSGSGTVTIQTAVAVAGSVNFSAFTGTLVQSTNMNIGSSTAGDFILGTGMTFTWTAGAIKLTTTKVSATSIDLAGKTVGNFTINGNGASFVLANDINASLACAFSGGTVDFNGFNVTCGNLSNGNTLTRTVNMRGGSITITGTGAIFDAPAGTLIFSWTSGARFVLSNTSASAKTFAGGTNTTYPIIEVAGAALAGTVTFSGAFTAAGLKFNPNANIKFTAGVTTTIPTAAGINWNGTLGNPITIQTTSGGSPATISVASGIVSADYLVLKDSTGSGGATFYAGANSTDATGNTGWTFSAAPVTTTRTVTAQARITQLLLKTTPGVARVQKAVPQTELGVARIQKTTLRTEGGVARIQVTVQKGGTRLWVPTDASVAVTWWVDASQLIGYSDGDPVSSWTDQSGNGAPASTAGTTFNAPHYKTGIINGKPVVRFVASNSEALRAYPVTSPTPATSDPASYFAVGKLNGGTNARLFGGIYPLLRNWLMGWWNGDEDVMYAEGFVAGGTIPAGTAVKVYGAVYTGSVTGFYNVGNLIASNGNGNNNINNGVALSGYDATGATNELSDGDLAECLIYDAALGTTDRQLVEGYLAWKYGVQAQLPGGHPYAAAAPTIATPFLGVARITARTPQTESGTARVTAKTTHTETGTSRIQGSVAKTEVGVSRIQIVTQRGATAVARITAITPRTIGGVSRVTSTTPRTEAGKARMQVATAQTESGKGRVTASTAQTAAGRARLTGTVTKPLSGLARIQKSVQRLVAAVARVTAAALKTIPGISRIQKAATKTVTGIASLVGLTTRTIHGIGSILGITRQTITGKAHILPPVAQGKEHYVLTNTPNHDVNLGSSERGQLTSKQGDPAIALSTAQKSTLTTGKPQRIVL